MAVEKLFPAKFGKIKLRQDALQTSFSVFLDIFYPPIFRCFDENGVFQQPQAITLIDPELGSLIPEGVAEFFPKDTTPVKRGEG